MKEIVKYHNDFNKIKLPNLTEQEQNLLFGIIGKIRETGYQDKIIFTSQELLKFSTEHLTNKALGNMLIILREKFFKADFTILIEDKERDLIGKEIINLFSSFRLWYPKKDSNYTNLLSVELQVNLKFAYLVNELTANFTRFELAEFMALSGKYTKTLYRLLKQYRQTGYLKMEWQEFVCVMDIPISKQIGEIDRDILKPALKELTKPRNLFDQERIPFEKLTYTKLKGKGRGRGGNVIGIEFSFKPQPTEAIEQKDIYTDFAEKHQGKIFFFEKFGKFEFKGLGRNQEQERIFVFDNELHERINDKVSNYPTQKSLNDLAKKIVN